VIDHKCQDANKGPVSEPLRFPVVLCGDIVPHNKRFVDSFSKATGLTVIHCSEDAEGVFAVCQRLNASLLIAKHEFIQQLTKAGIVRLTGNGSATHILALLDANSVERSIEMLRLGCRGVLSPRFSPKQLRHAIRAIQDGELWAPRRAVSSLLLELLRGSPSNNRDERGLTPQEQRILELSVQGHKNSSIASALFISVETVRWHKRRLYRKIGKSGIPKFSPSEAPSPRPNLIAG